MDLGEMWGNWGSGSPSPFRIRTENIKKCFRYWRREVVRLGLELDHYSAALYDTCIKREVSYCILTLYVLCIILKCVDKPTRCNTSYEWSLFFIIWLYMFRTITSPSSGVSSHKLYNALARSCYQASPAVICYPKLLTSSFVLPSTLF